jgi:hypothetical protein
MAMDDLGFEVLLESAILTYEVQLVCDRSNELALWVRNRLQSLLSGGVLVFGKDPAVESITTQLSKDASVAFSGDFTVMILNSETQEEIDYFTEAESITLLIDVTNPPPSVGLH